ncbi:MAG: 60S ribosomal protein L28 [Candidatus Hodarchaeales archaeon]
MESSDLVIAWNYLDKGHCAFKTSSSVGKIRCSHLFTVTGNHCFSDCPLIQPKYFSFQQQEGIVYLIEKNPEATPATMWGFTELPKDREEARKVVKKAIKGVNKELEEVIWRKFEQRFDVAKVIQTTQELEEDEEETS